MSVCVDDMFIFGISVVIILVGVVFMFMGVVVGSMVMNGCSCVIILGVMLLMLSRLLMCVIISGVGLWLLLVILGLLVKLLFCMLLFVIGVVVVFVVVLLLLGRFGIWNCVVECSRFVCICSVMCFVNVLL